MSVYRLIKELCSEIIKESDCQDCDLAKLKRVAFETLLKSSQNEKNKDLNVESLLEEYQFCSFELLLLNRPEDAGKVEKYVENIKENEQLLLSISSLLINLKDFSETSSGGKQVRKISITSILLNLFSFRMKISFESRRALFKTQGRTLICHKCR